MQLLVYETKTTYDDFELEAPGLLLQNVQATD